VLFFRGQYDLQLQHLTLEDFYFALKFKIDRVFKGFEEKKENYCVLVVSKSFKGAQGASGSLYVTQ